MISRMGYQIKQGTLCDARFVPLLLIVRVAPLIFAPEMVEHPVKDFKL